MFTNHSNNLLFIIRIKLNLIIFIFLTIFNDIYSETNLIQGIYPNCLLLQNGKLFITYINGTFLYDTELQTKYKDHIYFNKTIDEQNINLVSKNTIITQFSNNGIIICLVENAIYFFTNEGDFILMDFLPDLGFEYSKTYINLLTYKKEDNFYYYIIAFIKDNKNNYRKELYILYYKVNNLNNELIHQEIFIPFYFDFPEIYIYENYLGCGIMKSENKGDVLTCCFKAKEKDFIIIQSFTNEGNFEQIGEDIYSRIESPSGKYIRSITSENGKQLLTCYRENNVAGYCLVYDIDQNKIIKNNPLIKECSDNYIKFKLFYINQTHEYLFVCANNQNDFTIIKMDINFNVLNANNFSNSNDQISIDDFNSFSIFYDDNQNKYAFIIDAKNRSSNQNIIGKYFITTDFNSSNFDGKNPPAPFNVIYPSNSIINLPEDNKYFLNINESYERVITINEMNGIIIDFLDKNNQLIKTKENTEIKKEFMP